MSRKGLGQGSLSTVIRNGTRIWRAAWTDSVGHRHRELFGANESDARRRLAKIIRDRDLGIAGIASELGLDARFAPLSIAYMEDLKVRSVNAGTVSSHRTSLARIETRCEIVVVRDITHAKLNAYRISRLADGVSKATVNGDVRCLKAALAFGVRNGMIPVHPLAQFRRLAVTEADARRAPRALTEQEIADIFAVVPAGDINGLTLRGLLQTGARWNELRRVTWRDISGGCVHLRASTTKNRSSRSIPLSAGLTAALEEWRKVTPAPAQSDEVFRRPNGKVLDAAPQTWVDWFTRILGKAGVERRDAHGRVVHAHACRHTFITMLVRGGMPIQQIATLSGHHDINVLHRVYTHLRGEDLRDAVQTIHGTETAFTPRPPASPEPETPVDAVLTTVEGPDTSRPTALAWEAYAFARQADAPSGTPGQGYSF